MTCDSRFLDAYSCTKLRPSAGATAAAHEEPPLSVTLEQSASARENGRCVDCGQFISRNDIHFHGPKRKFNGPPRAHLFNDGGGMVTRCDDPEQARHLLLRKYAREDWETVYSKLSDADRADVDARFPEGRGEVQRGRINVVKDYEVSWWWMRLDDDAKGPGVTTAVVWAP